MADDRRMRQKTEQEKTSEKSVVDSPLRKEAGREEELKSMRDRLYSRTQQPERWERHALSDVPVVARNSSKNPSSMQDIAPPISPRRIDKPLERPNGGHWPPRPMRETPDTESVSAVSEPESISSMSQQPKKIALKGYRIKIVAIAALFFVVALVLSSSFLFFGQNTISGDNIAIAVEAPFAVGGGEELALTASITNKNAVPVESATLIVEYPPGTQETATPGKELFRERIPLGNIKQGEVLTIPVKAKLFGEENEEKTIIVSVEYRVEGSNATFFKEADPIVVKISSSPVVLSIDGVSEISSGQEVTLTLTVASNSPSAIENLLVQAEYPFGFDFSESEPRPAKGQNVWAIGTLAPGAQTKITVKGVMVGGKSEERSFKFSAGLPNERDRFALASALTSISTDIGLTDPFVGLAVTLNGKTDKTISVAQDDNVMATIVFTNTLSDTIYDGTIKVTLSGNGLDSSTIQVTQGFYDSSSRTIVWDRNNTSGLAALEPGEEQRVDFSIGGVNLAAERTPQVSFDVSVAGRRVSEERVPQGLTNIESRTVRFESVTALSSYGLYSSGPFTNAGPMPPRAESPTQYTIMVGAKNGSNELSDATVTMALPAYVTWQNVVSGGDTMTYNPNTREVAWTIGGLGANGSAEGSFQVTFLPSVSQVGTVPVLVGEQRLRATDRFTGSVVRATASAVTTYIPQDPNPEAQTGRVLPKQ
ncbi:hypothetical protein HY416_02495 [Candidatus Kaiserbacteria bacterium]|nr:hypothetical protein [Candidatus Kaiserbacteria bacterium]